jgi:hypothetical protein
VLALTTPGGFPQRLPLREMTDAQKKLAHTRSWRRASLSAGYEKP